MKKLSALIAAALIIAVSSCNFPGFVSVHPSGQYVAKKIQTGAFENVSVSSGFELILTQDSISSLSIETYENIHQYIIVEHDGNTLKISKENGINFTGNTDVKINLSRNYINEIYASGGSKVNLNNGWTADNLTVFMSGGGRIFGKVQLKSFDLNLSGGSKSEIEGAVENLTISSSGGGRHNNFSLVANKCIAHMSGGSSAELNVVEGLEIFGSGGSRVHYKGDPQITDHLSGGSSVSKAE